MQIKNLKVNEKNIEEMINCSILSNSKLQRNIYLQKLANGIMQGPLTNKPEVDKEWLKNYSEEDLKILMPEESIYTYMYKQNAGHLNDIAIDYFGKKMTYGEFFEEIDKCAKSFIKNGIKDEDIVTICMPSTPETLISFYALNKIGAVANMVHPLSSENQIRDFINKVDSKLVITIDSSFNKVKSILNETNVNKVVCVTPNNSMPLPLKMAYKFSKEATKIEDNDKLTKWNAFINEGKSIIEKIKTVPYRKNKAAVILQTGGTTGKSKGVVLTNDNFNGMVEQFRVNAKNFKRGDKMLTVMPPFHGFGLCSSVHLPLSFGVTAVLVPRVDINKIDKLMMKNKINHIVAVPTLFKGMMNVVNKKAKNGKLKNFDLSGLKYAVSGGSLAKNGFEESVDKFFEKYGADIKLEKGYGLSEAVAGVTFATGDMKQENTVGIPMVDTEIKIVDPETKNNLQNLQIGEICVKGPSVMKEYYNNKKETKSTLIDGWLHTGDLGYMKDGQLYFSERKGNMIISSGVNVYPNEIEQVIEKHDAVSACAVIGIYHPYKEEVPKAYIALKPGYEISDEINEEIQELCKLNLDRYSIPASFEYREDLPQTLLGKISHAELKKEEATKNNGIVKVYKKSK